MWHLSLTDFRAIENCDLALILLFWLGKSTTGVANAMIPAFTSFQYPPTLRTRAMGLTNFSAGFALISVPYIWLLVSPFADFFHIWQIFRFLHFFLISSLILHFSIDFFQFFYYFCSPWDHQKHVESYLPPLLLGLCGLLGALVLFFIDDRTAVMMAAERAPVHDKKLMESQQQQLGKQLTLHFMFKIVFGQFCKFSSGSYCIRIHTHTHNKSKRATNQQSKMSAKYCIYIGLMLYEIVSLFSHLLLFFSSHHPKTPNSPPQNIHIAQ